MSNPDTQFNPKTVNSAMGTPEWSIKPGQVYEAQKIKTVERTRIWPGEGSDEKKQTERPKNGDTKQDSSTDL